MKYLNKSTIIITVAGILLGFFFGWLIFRQSSSPVHDHSAASEETASQWTCSMHPSIRQSEPGQCPICGMDLIPVAKDNDAGASLDIRMSESAIKLANIQTAFARIQPANKIVQLTGKVQTDEKQVFSQTSHIPGRIESLSVNFTGEYIRKGQVLASVYSPELVTAQKELFEAYRIKDSQPALYQAAREKLTNWKLTGSQIDKILEQGKVREQLPIYADISGIVIEKSVNLGDYIRKGSVLYKIADLSRLWILFDLHETDIPWVRVGSKVTYTVQSIPGETFEGKISFIDPVIDPITRVAKARLSVYNKDLKLKPEMFVNGSVESTISDSLLVIPKSAVLWTGPRSIVYIKKQGASGVSFELREVVLGPSLGNSYVIKEGLEEGEEFVVNGTFSVDAAAQLAGKPSMMNPEQADQSGSHTHNAEKGPAYDINKAIELKESTNKKLSGLITNYLELKDALVSDDFESAIASAKKVKSSYSNIAMTDFEGDAHLVWMADGATMAPLLEQMTTASEIKNIRDSFKPFSSKLINMTRVFNPMEQDLFIQHCPMADDFNGADWLSLQDNVMNPYFGASMLTCGEVTDTISNITEVKTKPASNVKSPKMEAMATIGDNHIHIEYSSPRVRGRVIFGGLVPYNVVWATGAHKATNISFSKDVKIGGKIIPAGKYGLFTVPGRETWVVIINKKWDQHLADEYDEKDDLVRLKVTPNKEENSLEELTFEVTSIDQKKGKIKFQWAETSFEFLVENNN